MSTLQVANIHLESTANNRIQYAGSNSFVIVAGGANTLTVNSIAISIPSGITLQSANVYLESTGNNRIQYAGSNSFAIVAGGANTLTVNTTAVGVPSGISLQSANVQLESTGNNRIQYDGSNTFTVYAGGVNALTVNTTSIDVNTNAIFSAAITETVYSVSGTTPALSAVNGTIQRWTLTGASTPTSSLTTGQSITLMINDGTAYTITWPSVTWVNNGAVAPTLATSGYTVVVLWNAAGTLYGALVGNQT